MDIEKLVKRECKNPDSEHDKHYERALRSVYKAYEPLEGDEDRIKINLDWVRKKYAGELQTHAIVASCMVLYEMLTEAKRKKKCK